MTIYQIIVIYDNSKALDEKEYMCMVFCDICKAFEFGLMVLSTNVNVMSLDIIFLTGYTVIYMTESNALY